MTPENKLSSRSLFLLWAGAAVSLAEIMTGGALAGMPGFQSWGANLLGHLMGAGLFFSAGWIAFQRKTSAMGTVVPAFGERGRILFSLINLLQLVGWTAVMVLTGGDTLAALLGGLPHPLARGCIGLVLLGWTALGIRGSSRLNGLSVILLLGLMAVMGWQLSGITPRTADNPSALPFGEGMELALLMPLSWLPLVGDYTSRARRGMRGTAAGTLGYFLGSVGMYALGAMAASALGTTDPGSQLLVLGLGVAGIIVVLSTVTTGFLDVWSAGLALTHLAPRLEPKTAALLTGILGVGLGIFFPMDRYLDFLALIGSVFAPLFAVILTHFLLLPLECEASNRPLPAFVAWGLGLGCNFLLRNTGTPAGLTLPTMVITALSYLLIKKGALLWKN